MQQKFLASTIRKHLHVYESAKIYLAVFDVT